MDCGGILRYHQVVQMLLLCQYQLPGNLPGVAPTWLEERRVFTLRDKAVQCMHNQGMCSVFSFLLKQIKILINSGILQLLVFLRTRSQVRLLFVTAPLHLAHLLLQSGQLNFHPTERLKASMSIFIYRLTYISSQNRCVPLMQTYYINYIEYPGPINTAVCFSANLFICYRLCFYLCLSV